MTRIIIICEGQTEREFCKNVLSPYLCDHKIHIQAPLIKRSMGGIVSWQFLKKEIEIHLSENNAYVSSFLDYYGLYEKHCFPNWIASSQIVDPILRVNYLEESMKEDISENLRYRFIPYLQLHEFESLLFNDIQLFTEHVPIAELVGRDELIRIFDEYENPELINNNRATSPSHRLQRIIKGYNKLLYGHYFAEAIGIEKIRGKCPRFDLWVKSLIEAGTI